MVGPAVRDDSFDLVETAVAVGGATSALDLLARKFLAEKQYPQLFETRLMQKRLELGLPLIQLGAIEDLPEPARSGYEDGVRQAAKKPAGCFWPRATFNTPGRISVRSGTGKQLLQRSSKRNRMGRSMP